MVITMSFIGLFTAFMSLNMCIGSVVCVAQVWNHEDNIAQLCYKFFIEHIGGYYPM